MANKPVVSSGPIEITDSLGKQVLIPLTALYFDSSGKIKAEQWPAYTANPALQAPVDQWLAYLVKQGLITPGNIPAPKPAFQVEAKDPGSNGNTITVQISKVTADLVTPGNSTADVTVTETNTYSNLSPATILGVIGKVANTGSRPGLVFCSTIPPAMPPAAISGNLAGSPPVFDVGGAFTLQGKEDVPAAPLTTITIQDVDAGTQTFTLIATWTKTVKAVAMSALDTQFGYVIHVSGAVTAPPAAGTITLTGGADAMTVKATKAAATVLALA